MDLPKLKLRDGNEIPMLAFGTGTAWFKEPEDAGKFNPAVVEIVKQALQAGFHHLDCAEIYNNEEEVGVAISQSGIARKDLFVTTKVGDGIKDIPGTLDKSLKKLQLDYVDLFLIHEPWDLKTPQEYQDAWRAMEAVKKAGKAKSIGVSNFIRSDIEQLLGGGTSDPPVVNQLEYHAYLQRENDGELYIPWLQRQGIQVEAFKGLTPVARCPEGPLVPLLKRLAESYSTNESAVMLRWLLQQNVVAVTTTSHATRLKDYAAALTFKLTDGEVREISEVGRPFFKRFYYPERYPEGDRC